MLNHIFHADNDDRRNSAVRGQKAVSAHFTSKQILPFAFAKDRHQSVVCSTHLSGTYDTLVATARYYYGQNSCHNRHPNF